MKRLLLAMFCVGNAWAWWSPSIDLGLSGVDDIHPQACRVQSHGYGRLAMVWESYLDGNADIVSRFSSGPAWSDTFRVTADPGHDICPSIAYDYTRDCFWCVWRRYGAAGAGIYVAQGNEMTGWSAAYQLTSDTLFEDLPSVCVIHDTVWIVWQRGALFGDSISFMNIHAAYYDGSVWSPPCPLTSDSNVINRRAKVGMRYPHPLVVWERDGDIYYCEHIGGSWHTAQPVTADIHENINPDLAHGGDLFGAGAWIVWQTDRDGNYEIYTTAYDTFDVHYRVTFNDAADITPSPLQFQAATRQGGPPVTAFSSDRNGNQDIYTHFNLWPSWDTLLQVDTSQVDDISPVMTASPHYLWVIWQTDRDGDWDIYGSYMGIGGIEEHGLAAMRSAPHIFPNPAKASFILHSAMPVQGIRIYDVLGRLVRTRVFAEFRGMEEISLTGVNAGVYFVIVATNEDEFISKIIVTK
ncbi:T9SS type A sorting domain-containing protein [candidate division WOR-3 bacterium]|nr:T9SS type A sorting domain-containing protein [candidate division WOR-3 bacterium]